MCKNLIGFGFVVLSCLILFCKGCSPWNPDCGEKDPCTENVCAPHGICFNDYGKAMGVCVCESGYFGKYCDKDFLVMPTPVISCVAVYCENGDCVEGQCVCFPGYAGLHCETVVPTTSHDTLVYNIIAGWLLVFAILLGVYLLLRLGAYLTNRFSRSRATSLLSTSTPSIRAAPSTSFSPSALSSLFSPSSSTTVRESTFMVFDPARATSNRGFSNFGQDSLPEYPEPPSYDDVCQLIDDSN